MFNPSILNFDDFYFNGHWLSEFDGIIAGKDGLAPFSLIPSKEIKTEKGIIGRHGELVYGSVYNPRIIPVPVVFKDLSRIREIASWLDIDMPTEFYYKDDKLKIKAIHDEAIDVEHGYIETNLGGEITLKFIAHYPFYSAVNGIKYIINKNTVNNSSTSNYVTTINSTTLSDITIINDGNRISYPLIKIIGTGSITIDINDISFTIDNLTDYVYFDTKYMTVYKLPLINKTYDVVGKVPIMYLNAGNNIININEGRDYVDGTGQTISLTGNCISVEIQVNAEWI